MPGKFLPSSGFRARDAQKRIGAILRSLAKTYPGARTALVYRTPFELLIATILSAQSTDETVNRVTPGLFERYPNAASLAAAPIEAIESIVRPTGFFHQKTKAIIGCAKVLTERFNGEVPERLEDLIELPGVARKTANVVLSNCCPWPKSNHGIFVDTHVRRTTQRLALTEHDEPDDIEKDLMKLVPKTKWAELPHQLVFLGRGPCRATRPAHEQCPLLDSCPTGQSELEPRPKRAPRSVSHGLKGGKKGKTQIDHHRV